jgi:hypothetical protein
VIVYRDNVDYGSAATKRDAATTGREVAANLPAVTKTADPDYRITCVFVEAPPVCGGCPRDRMAVVAPLLQAHAG